MLPVGETDIIFKTATRLSNPYYHFAINIPANKIEEARDWLSGKVELIWFEDYKSDIADFAGWHARSVYFFDSAGNIIELIARFDLDNSTEEPFNANQFLSVSEVGLVFMENEIDQRTAELMNRYSLPFFSKQLPEQQFKVVGDDLGLFIIVSEHRKWYTTNDKEAGIFPMEIEFRNKDKEYLLKL
jgi:catechol-2,3-dioxygenase